MNVLLVTLGSAGDVHPLVGIGAELAARGHAVTLATSDPFADLIDKAGLDFHSLGTEEEFRDVIHDPDLWHKAKSFPLLVRKGVLPALRRQYELIEQTLSAQPQTIVLANCLSVGVRVARDARDFPLLTVHPQPSALWSRHAPPKMPLTFVPTFLAHPRLKQLELFLGEKFFIDRALCPGVNEFRAELGLPPMRKTLRWWHSPDGVLGMFPDWFSEEPQSDWPANVHRTGFPLYDESGLHTLPSEVDAFLTPDDPPILVAPGSANVHGHHFFFTAAKAAQLLGRRALCVTREPNQLPDPLPSHVLHADYLPFGDVLPRCAALVHPGGVGTVAQSIRSACPQLIVPHVHDQPDNAARVRALGLGDWIKPAKFRPKLAASRLGALLASQEVRTNCEHYATLMRRTDGRATAADVVEQTWVKWFGTPE